MSRKAALAHGFWLSEGSVVLGPHSQVGTLQTNLQLRRVGRAGGLEAFPGNGKGCRQLGTTELRNTEQ